MDWLADVRKRIADMDRQIELLDSGTMHMRASDERGVMQDITAEWIERLKGYRADWHAVVAHFERGDGITDQEKASGS